MHSRSIKTLTLAAGSGSKAIVQILIIALLSRMLTKPDYATFRQTLLVYTMIGPILALGLPSGILYFFPKHPNRTRNILTENFLLLSGIGFVFALVLLLGGADLVASLFNNPELSTTLRWFAFYPVFTLPVLLYQPTMVASNRVIWVAIYTAVSQLIRAFVVLLPLFLFAKTPLLAIQMFVLFSALSWIPSLMLMFSVADKGTYQPSKSSVGSQLKYCVPLGLSSFINTINISMDKTVVASMFAKEAFAEFVNGAMEVPFINFVTGSAASILVPEISQLYREEKYDEAVDLFRRSGVKCGSILIPIAGILFLLAPQLMHALYGPGYSSSATIFRIYLILLPFRSVSYGVLFQGSGRSDLVLTRACINLFLNLFLTVLLASWFGPIGAAFGTVASILGFVFPYCIITSAYLFKVSPFRIVPIKELTTLVVITICSAGSAWAFGSFLGQGWVRLIAVVAIYFALSAIALKRYGYLDKLLAPIAKLTNSFTNTKTKR